MKPVLILFRVKKIVAEIPNEITPQGNIQLEGGVNQTGETSYGENEKKEHIVRSAMTLDASLQIAGTSTMLCKVHTEVEGFFLEIEPALQDESVSEEAKRKIADFYASMVYSHAVSHINRVYHDMGFGAASIPLKYAGPL